MNGEGKNEGRTSEIPMCQLPTAAVTTATAKVDDKCRVLCARSLTGSRGAKVKVGPVLLPAGAKEDCFALFVCLFAVFV